MQYGTGVDGHTGIYAQSRENFLRKSENSIYESPSELEQTDRLILDIFVIKDSDF